jgi:hypothetical protein
LSYTEKVRRQRKFSAGRKAAIKQGWKPFTKMNESQHVAFVEAYNEES